MVAFTVAGDQGKDEYLVGPGATPERRCRVISVNEGGSTVTYQPYKLVTDPPDFVPAQQTNVAFASVTSKAVATPGGGLTGGTGAQHSGHYPSRGRNT